MPKTKTQMITLALLYTLFALAVVAMVSVIATGPTTISLLDAKLAGAFVNMALRLDSLSIIILLMASFLGIVIGQYSVRYLDGETRQDAFFLQLFLTVLAVAALVTASSLVTMFISWLAISAGLHKLLLFYPNRPNAVVAARKKFLVSRLGDLFLLIGIIFVYQAFGTFEFEEIFKLTQGVLNSSQTLLLAWSGMFLVFGAMTKSAQFPFHFWLPETMETPTPVSALMHAGIINAGGFLLIRLSPLIAHASVASLVLAVVGAFTGVYASLVMITQNDIKRKLAYSTISQMGLMMFACGIGLYTFALFHIVAHSLYKAHAFLSTGNLIEESKKISLTIHPQSHFKIFLFIGLGLAMILLGLDWHNGKYVPEITYLSVLLLGLSQNTETLLVRSKIGAVLLLLIGSALVIACSLFAGFETLIHYVTSSEILGAQMKIDTESPLFVICMTSYLVFAVGFYLANGLIHPENRIQQRLYVHLWNGGYFATRSHRFFKALNLI